MTRLEANREILERLSVLVEKYPDWRWHQLMRNADVIQTLFSNDGTVVVKSEFYVESEETLNRMKAYKG